MCSPHLHPLLHRRLLALQLPLQRHRVFQLGDVAIPRPGGGRIVRRLRLVRFPNFVISLALVAFANGLWMCVGGFFVSPTILNPFWKYVFHYIDYQVCRITFFCQYLLSLTK